MRCCLMRLLLKFLSDMLKSPQLLSHIHICPKPKVKLGPTESFYPAPPSSVDIATARNPSPFGLTNRDLGLTEMGLQSLCMDLLPKSVSPSLSNRYYRDYNANSLVNLLPKQVLPSLSKLCVTVRFCVEAIYTPPPPLH